MKHIMCSEVDETKHFIKRRIKTFGEEKRMKHKRYVKRGE